MLFFGKKHSKMKVLLDRTNKSTYQLKILEQGPPLLQPSTCWKTFPYQGLASGLATNLPVFALRSMELVFKKTHPPLGTRGKSSMKTIEIFGMVTAEGNIIYGTIFLAMDKASLLDFN